MNTIIIIKNMNYLAILKNENVKNTNNESNENDEKGIKNVTDIQKN